MALFLKYLTWALTVGVAFAGSWLFEVARTDPNTGKKTLTVWGRRGIVVALLSLLGALSLTVWSDMEAARKAAEAAHEKAEAARERAKEKEVAAREATKTDTHRKTLETAIGELLSLARITAKYEATFDKADRSALREALSGDTQEIMKQLYPESYEQLLRSSSASDLMKRTDQLLNKMIQDQVSTTRECAGIPIQKLPGGSMSATFMLSPKPSNVSVLLAGQGVQIDASFWQDDVLLKSQPYLFNFEDGTSSPMLQCQGLRTTYGCRDNTTDTNIRALFKTLQQKQIISVAAGGRTFKVEPSVAALMRRTFSCITP